MKAKEYGRRLDAMNARIEAALPANEARSVFYSAYKLDGDELPVDNLDEVAVTGPCRLAMSHDGFWGPGENFLSEVLQSPTWLQVAVVANRGIRVTGDYHHVFLENVEKKKGNTDIPVFNVWMGS